ncbi:hypothetical protein E2P81_ATG03039 [Venturia nashicola]|uniref:Uncharacterized protein n=1 Tax=Venturia nashicola TaxID=86259 RepID=A0A4Z1P3U4_9PEZI|nr:hypothetical protein E6O75_ATG03103 [Venturia nashicola]TLD36150.1 hypothetical protein E2P81_ATG03039 [Venturia nashicola]
MASWQAANPSVNVSLEASSWNTFSAARTLDSESLLARSFMPAIERGELHDSAQKRSGHHVSSVIESDSSAGCCRWNGTERSRGPDSLTDRYQPIDSYKMSGVLQIINDQLSKFFRASVSDRNRSNNSQHEHPT